MNVMKYIIIGIFFIFLKSVHSSSRDFKNLLIFSIVVLLFDIVKWIKMKHREKNAETLIVEGKIVSKRVDTRNYWIGSGKGSTQLSTLYLYVIVIEDKNNNRYDIVMQENRQCHLLVDIYNLEGHLKVKVKKYKDSDYYYLIKE